MPHDPAAWENFISAQPKPHLLQTAAWGELKASFGWQPETVRAGEAGALVLFRRLPLGLTLAYVPRGPLADWQQPAQLQALVAALDEAARARRALCLKWEPDLPDDPGCASLLAGLGFRPSPHSVQPRRSLVVDLRGSEAEVLARMKQKTRYNIGLASKKGVTARAAQGPEDIERFNALMQATGARDGFGIHAPAYYRRAYELFQPTGQCELLLAEHEGALLAGVMVFALGTQAWYLYGASSDQERQRMAPYLAQWAAMRWARARGAEAYDLWGVPDEDEAVLEAGFEQRHDGLWGVYRFKRGFGGQLVRTVGAWDRVYNPLLYQAYLLYLKRRGLSLG
jgi:lipid II:glycine glycyltransferase (peptidoglycan interpeptide bridge formation enzyme)